MRWVLGTLASLILIVPLTVLATRLFVWELERERMLFPQARSAGLLFASWWASYGLFVLITPLRLDTTPGLALAAVLAMSLTAKYLLFAVQLSICLAPARPSRLEVD